jgi:hypothetical protein
MSVRGPRLLRIVHPTQHIRTAIIPCPNYSPLPSRLPSPPHSQPIRFLTRTALLRTPPPPPHPLSNDRGPVSEEDTQTDFSTLDVLANSPPPATAVDACLPDGFHLSNGLKIGGGSGCLLVGGEAFEWRPWDVSRSPRPMINGKGQWDVAKEAWALLEVVWPKPGELESLHAYLSFFFFPWRDIVGRICRN